MNRKATTVVEYLASLPADRRTEIESVRKVIRKHMPKGIKEGMQYGMIGYFVPHSRYPAGYHCDPKQPLPFGGLAAQKNHLSIYLMFLYPNGKHEQDFKKAWIASGRKLDMGRCCVRFKTSGDAALDVIANALKSVSVDQFIEFYESSIGPARKRSEVKCRVSDQKKSASRSRSGRSPRKA